MRYKRILVVLASVVLWSCKDGVTTVETSMSVERVKEVSISNSSREMYTKETIQFPSKDGVLITADIYKVANKPVSILLCHQAGIVEGSILILL